MTGIAAVTAAFKLSVRSVAVTVFVVPASLSLTLNCLVPAANGVLVGKVAKMSLELNAIISVAVFTRFQLSSTALRVTLNAVSGAGFVGVPVLLVVVPGAADSPGVRINSFVNAPGLTTTLPDSALVRLVPVNRTFIVSANG